MPALPSTSAALAPSHLRRAARALSDLDGRRQRRHLLWASRAVVYGGSLATLLALALLSEPPTPSRGWRAVEPPTVWDRAPAYALDAETRLSQLDLRALAALPRASL